MPFGVGWPLNSWEHVEFGGFSFRLLFVFGCCQPSRLEYVFVMCLVWTVVFFWGPALGGSFDFILIFFGFPFFTILFPDSCFTWDQCVWRRLLWVCVSRACRDDSYSWTDLSAAATGVRPTPVQWISVRYTGDLFGSRERMGRRL